MFRRIALLGATRVREPVEVTTDQPEVGGSSASSAVLSGRLRKGWGSAPATPASCSTRPCNARQSSTRVWVHEPRIRRVSRWINDLLHDRSRRGFRGADEDVNALAAAIELQNASPSAGLPDPQFVDSLRHRIARETRARLRGWTPRLSRRALLASVGLAACRSAAARRQPARLPVTAQHELVPDGGAGTAVYPPALPGNRCPLPEQRSVKSRVVV
jgi:hypothetical protein